MSYKTNFLKSVILRLDFSQIELARLKLFIEKYSKEFPHIEEKKGTEEQINLNLKTKEFRQESNSVSVWKLYSADKTVVVQISSTSILIEYFKFEDFKRFISKTEILSNFIIEFNLKTVTRLGLRFMNEIKIDGIKELSDWKSYIVEAFLGTVIFSVEKKKALARAMGLIVYKEEFGDINLNYGLWNSAFPNIVSDKTYILDFDAFSKYPLDTEGLDLKKIVSAYYNSIKLLFESIIEERLRKIMNNER